MIMHGANITKTASASSLDQILCWYGFTTQQQHQAFELVLQRSGVINPNQSLAEAFPPKSLPDDTLADWLHVIRATQEKFFKRSNGQERWEIEVSEWMDEHAADLYGALDVLGFVKNRQPTVTNTHAICILGATYDTMCERIVYTQELVNSGQIKTKAIILLAGERLVAQGVDGSPEQLGQIAKRYGIDDWQKLTETHLIEDIYNKSSLARNTQIAVYSIDTPRGALIRPTTQTTIHELISCLQQHPDIERITFVSTQPYILYQKAVIDGCMQLYNYPILYEVVGSASSESSEPQALLEGLASCLWTGLPTFLVDMKHVVTSERVCNMLDTLYARNALLHTIVKNMMMFTPGN